MEERIVYLEDHDLLTQLPNRAALTPYLDGMIEAGGWESVAVIALDIDQFKMVNESTGEPSWRSNPAVAGQKAQAGRVHAPWRLCRPY